MHPSLSKRFGCSATSPTAKRGENCLPDRKHHQTMSNGRQRLGSGPGTVAAVLAFLALHAAQSGNCPPWKMMEIFCFASATGSATSIQIHIGKAVTYQKRCEGDTDALNCNANDLVYCKLHMTVSWCLGSPSLKAVCVAVRILRCGQPERQLLQAACAAHPVQTCQGPLLCGE